MEALEDYRTAAAHTPGLTLSGFPQLSLPLSGATARRWASR
jgi:hypothetical protein